MTKPKLSVEDLLRVARGLPAQFDVMDLFKALAVPNRRIVRSVLAVALETHQIERAKRRGSMQTYRLVDPSVRQLAVALGGSIHGGGILLTAEVARALLERLGIKT